MSEREFAYLDVSPEMLVDVVSLMPRAIRIYGSGKADGAVRLWLDVTETGKTGGAWVVTISDDVTTRVVEFGPRHD